MQHTRSQLLEEPGEEVVAEEEEEQLAQEGEGLLRLLGMGQQLEGQEELAEVVEESGLSQQDTEQVLVLPEVPLF